MSTSVFGNLFLGRNLQFNYTGLSVFVSFWFLQHCCFALIPAAALNGDLGESSSWSTWMDHWKIEWIHQEASSVLQVFYTFQGTPMVCPKWNVTSLQFTHIFLPHVTVIYIIYIYINYTCNMHPIFMSLNRCSPDSVYIVDFHSKKWLQNQNTRCRQITSRTCTGTTSNHLWTIYYNWLILDYSTGKP